MFPKDINFDFSDEGVWLPLMFYKILPNQSQKKNRKWPIFQKQLFFII